MNRFHTKPIRLEALYSILSDVSSKTESAPLASVPPDALRELTAVLGKAKVQGVVDSFFETLNTFISDLEAGTLDDDPERRAATCHKIKGAAAMLGQVDIEAALVNLEAEEDEATDQPNKIMTLKETARQARLTIQETLDAAD